MKFLAWLRTALRSKYILFLEAERERLLAELRLWQDAALAKDGLPRLTPQPRQPLPHLAGKPLPSQWRRKMETLVAEIQERKPNA